MPTKRKSKKKGGGAGGKEKAIRDGLDPSEMSKKQLIGLIKRMLEERDQEKEERNFFMLEREKLFSLWELGKEQLKMERSKNTHLEANLDNNEKARDNENKIMQTKLRYLEAENTMNVGALRLFHLNELRIVQDEVWNLESMFRETSLAKKNFYRLSHIGFEQVINSMKIKHSQQISRFYDQMFDEMKGYSTKLLEQFYQDSLLLDEKYDDMREDHREIVEKRYNEFREHERLFKFQGYHYYDKILIENNEVIYMVEYEIKKEKWKETLLKKEVTVSAQAYHDTFNKWKLVNENYQKWRKFDSVNIPGLAKKEWARKKRLGIYLSYIDIVEAANETLRQQIEIIKKDIKDHEGLLFKALVQKKKSFWAGKIFQGLQNKELYRNKEC